MECKWLSQIVFYTFAALMIASAMMVVYGKNLIYSAFALLATFFGVAVLYVLLGADFLAGAQLLIYVGGILILLLFGVMLTHRIYDMDLKTETFQVIPGAVVSLTVFGLALGRHLSNAVEESGIIVEGPTTEPIGRLCSDRVHSSLRGGFGLVAGGLDRGRHDRPREDGSVIPLEHYLVVSAALFSLGLFGVLTRKNAINVLMSIELMLNSANINLVAFSRFVSSDLTGQIFAVFVIVVAACEAAVALAIVLSLYRILKTVHLDEARALKG